MRARSFRSVGVIVVAVFWTLAADGRRGAASTSGRDTVVLDVPFLAQPPELCGGAAVAMVQRYWGDERVHAGDYRRLVDPELGGITTSSLVAELRSRGWRAFSIRADRRIVAHHLSRGRPLVALLDQGSSSLHYVVVTGSSGTRLVIHDPALGPWQTRSASEIFSSWEKTGYWALLVLPPPSPSALPEPHEDAAPFPDAETLPAALGSTACGPLLEAAIGRREAAAASMLLSTAAELCPDDGVVARELAALRFREEDWPAAVALAEKSVRLEPADEHAWSLLAASRFLGGDRDGALDAWNVIGEPRIDTVEVGGLERSRQDVVHRYLGLTPGGTLSRESLERARRRARELPSAEGARVSFEPIHGGRARVLARLAESGLLGPFWPAMTRAAVDALVDREARLDLRSPVRSGGRIELGGRFWRGRPAVHVSLSAPRMMGLPGVATLSGFAEEQGYAVSDGPPRLESRRGASLRVGEWITADTRLELGAGLDQWRSRGSWIALGAAIDRRLLDDRLSLRAGVGRWLPVDGSLAFGELAGSIRARLPFASGWRIRGRFDARAVSRDAPFGVWSGAGTGRAGKLLLRGYPLLTGSVVGGDAFAPSMLHGSIELEREVWSAGVAALGLASFYDWARPWGRPGTSARNLSSLGLGARIHVRSNTIRLDGAIRPEDGGFAFSAGWVESW